jgi:hypothetical protein
MPPSAMATMARNTLANSTMRRVRLTRRPDLTGAGCWSAGSGGTTGAGTGVVSYGGCSGGSQPPTAVVGSPA